MKPPGAPPSAAVFPRFADLLAALAPNAVVAVDMPIGLPDRVGRNGRGPEALVRQRLGARRSSVFAIPSRRAVESGAGPWTDAAARRAAFREACERALATSEPPRKPSIQAFGLFPKIVELDRLLRAEPALAARVVESHPELAFRRLDGGQPMRLPKKEGGRPSPAGIAERAALLAAHGLPPALLAERPKGAGADDLLDAAALLFVAARHVRGETERFPDPPECDARGLPVAIRV